MPDGLTFKEFLGDTTQTEPATEGLSVDDFRSAKPKKPAKPVVEATDAPAGVPFADFASVPKLQKGAPMFSPAEQAHMDKQELTSQPEDIKSLQREIAQATDPKIKAVLQKELTRVQGLKPPTNEADYEGLDQPPESIGQKLKAGVSTILKAPKAILGMGEATTEFATNLAASFPALSAGITAAIKSKDPQKYAEVFHQVQEQYTEKAQTDEGKMIVEGMNQLMALYEKGVDWTIDATALDKFPAAAALVKGAAMVAPMVGLAKAPKEGVPFRGAEDIAPVQVKAKRIEPPVGDISKTEAGPTVTFPKTELPERGSSPVKPRVDLNQPEGVQGLREHTVDLAKSDVGGKAEPYSIPRAENLSETDRAIESRFADEIGQDVPGAISAYREKFGKVINTDNARTLSADYEADRSRSAAVHEPASWLTKRVYEQALKEEPKPGELPEVLFTAGGTGSGKTTAIQSIGSVADRAQIIYDTNMNTPESALAKVNQALEAGKDVTIAYVHRGPIESFGAAIDRSRNPKSESFGRTVPIDEHIKTHQGALPTVRAMMERFKDDKRVKFIGIDNTRGPESAQVVPVESLKPFKYNRVREAIERKLQEAGLSKQAQEGFLGRASQEARPGTRGEPEPQRSGEPQEIVELGLGPTPKAMLDNLLGKPGDKSAVFRPLRDQEQVGTFRWERQASSIGQDIRKSVPEKADREAITKAVQSGSDAGLTPEQIRVKQAGQQLLSDMGDRLVELDKIEGKLERYVPQIWDLTDKATRAKIDQWQKQKGQSSIEPGSLLERVLGRPGGGARNPFTMERTVPDYAEGVKLGLKPKNLDFAALVETYAKKTAMTIERARTMRDLRELKSEDGTPMLVQAGAAADASGAAKAARARGAGSAGATADLSKAAKILRVSPETLSELARSGEVPAKKVARPLKAGGDSKLMQWQFAEPDLLKYLDKKAAEGSGYVKVDAPGLEHSLVHPDIAADVRVLMEADNPTTFGKALQLLSYTGKRIGTAGTLFHAASLYDAWLGSGGFGRPPIPGLRHPAIEAALQKLRDGGMGDALDRGVKAGLKIGPALEDVAGRERFLSMMDAADKMASKVGAGKPVRLLKAFDEKLQHFTWDYVHTGFKVDTYLRTIERLERQNLKREPGKRLTQEQMERSAAQATNAMFGGLNWERGLDAFDRPWARHIMSEILNKSGRRWQQTFLFAPDWLYSTLGSWGNMAAKNAAKRGIAMRYVALSAFYYTLVGNALNYYFTGHSMFDNEPEGKDRSWQARFKAKTQVQLADGRHMNISKHFMEVPHLVAGPAQFAMNKMGVVPREAAQQALNKDYLSPNMSDRYPPSITDKRDDFRTATGKRLAHAGKQFLPFTAKGGDTSATIAGFLGRPIYGRTRVEKEKEREAEKAKRKADRKLDRQERQ